MSRQSPLDDAADTEALARALWTYAWRRTYHRDPPDGAWENERFETFCYYVGQAEAVRGAGWSPPLTTARIERMFAEVRTLRGLD